jgi:deoxyribose-phosphate aldolase
MVMHLGHLRAGNYSYVAVDIAEVVRVCREAGVVCKVILETGALCEDEKGLAASIALACGADFVKTSTGFGPGGA